MSLYPLGPVFDGAGLNVTVLSYCDSMGFGFMACPDAVPGLWDLAAHVEDAVEELVKAAGVEASGETA
jgi:diacylglycerol O-acyltransferase / wax synthase